MFYCGRTLILLRVASRLGESTGQWVDTPSWQRLSQPVSEYTHTLKTVSKELQSQREKLRVLYLFQRELLMIATYKMHRTRKLGGLLKVPATPPPIAAGEWEGQQTDDMVENELSATGRPLRNVGNYR